MPIVKEYSSKSMPLLAKEDVFPCSMNLVLECARTKDAQGKRSSWYMIGGEERIEATELYRMACSICEQIYNATSIQYVRVLKEFAEHLESRH